MSTPRDVLIELGDVIQIIAPSNPAINDGTYIVDYIDSSTIRLVNVDTLAGYTLNIRDGSLTDESITGINIIDKADTPGYATQNGLVPKTWLDIHFGGDQPMVITGEVTDLDNDMIEIKTFPDKKTIYIDFAYQGIPADLPIEKIAVRDKPERLVEMEQHQRLATVAEEGRRGSRRAHPDGGGGGTAHTAEHGRQTQVAVPGRQCHSARRGSG